MAMMWKQSTVHSAVTEADRWYSARLPTLSSRRDIGKELSVVPQRALFGNNVEAMKQQIKESIYKPKYNVADLYHQKGWAQHIARHPCFEQVALAVIALNALWLAIDADYNHAEVLYKAHWVFPVVENCFCIFFFLEWLCRYFAFQRKCDSLRDAWFVFDGTLVFMMAIETWVVSIVLAAIGVDFQAHMGDASILRLIRLLRLTRMARMAHLLRASPELMILVKGMIAATRSVFFTLCLLVIIIYVFAIGFVQLTKGTEFGDMYFESVSLAMFTLLLRGTYLDDITQVMDDMRKESIFLVLAFLTFVLLAAQTVTNMLIGVLCEVVSLVAATEKEEMMVSLVVTKIGDILLSLDCDKDHLISKKEFMMILNNSEATRTLQEVGVDAVSLVDFTDVIFARGDHDEEASLTFEEFMDVVLRFRGTNTATVKDVLESQKILRSGIRNAMHHLKKIEEGLASSGIIEPVVDVQSTFALQSWRPNTPMKSSLNRSSPRCKQKDALVWNAPRSSNEFHQSPHVPVTKGTAQCLQTHSIRSNALELPNVATNTGVESSTKVVEGMTHTSSSPQSVRVERYTRSIDGSTAQPRELGAATLMETLSSHMLTMHQSMMEAVSAHLKDESHLRKAAEHEVARLQDQNQQLRDMLRNVDEEFVETRVLLHATSTGNVISSAAYTPTDMAVVSSAGAKRAPLNPEADALSKLLPPTNCATQLTEASTLPVTIGSAAPLESMGDVQQASASSVEKLSASAQKRQSEHDPSEDRHEVVPIAPSHDQSPIPPHRAEVKVHVTAASPVPNHTPPHPVDEASSLSPEHLFPVVHLESTSTCVTVHQASSVRAPSSGTRGSEGEDKLSDVRHEFFPIAPADDQSPSPPNRAEGESNPQASRAAGQSPAPNHAPPCPGPPLLPQECLPIDS